MAKQKSSYVCGNCGANYTKWSGRCEDCGEWNSLVEQLQAAVAGKSAVAKSANSGSVLDVSSLKNISIEEGLGRLDTGVADVDTVLLQIRRRSLSKTTPHAA